MRIKSNHRRELDPEIERGLEAKDGQIYWGCKKEKETAEHVEDCEDFERVLGMNMVDLLKGTNRRQTIRKEKGDKRRTRNQKPIMAMVIIYSNLL